MTEHEFMMLVVAYGYHCSRAAREDLKPDTRCESIGMMERIMDDIMSEYRYIRNEAVSR